jgi:hypothetical protein
MMARRLSALALVWSCCQRAARDTRRLISAAIGFGAAQRDAGDGVDAAGADSRHDDGLADALELRQGHPVLYGIHRQALRREAPLGGATLGEADGLDDRDVQLREGLGDGLPVLGGADDEILDYHQGSRPGRGQQPGQALDGLPGAATPAGQDLGAGQALAAGFGADRGSGAGFDIGQVKHGQGWAGRQQAGVPGVGIDALDSANAQAQAGLRSGRGQGAAASRCLNRLLRLSLPPACQVRRASSQCCAAGAAAAASRAACGGASPASWRRVSAGKLARAPARERLSRLRRCSPLMASTVLARLAGIASMRRRAGSPKAETASTASASSHWRNCRSVAAWIWAGVRSRMRSRGWRARCCRAASTAVGAARSVTTPNRLAAWAPLQATCQGDQQQRAAGEYPVSRFASCHCASACHRAGRGEAGGTIRSRMGFGRLQKGCAREGRRFRSPVPHPGAQLNKCRRAGLLAHLHATRSGLPGPKWPSGVLWRCRQAYSSGDCAGMPCEQLAEVTGLPVSPFPQTRGRHPKRCGV